MPQPSNGPAASRPQGMTIAQKLYASSGNRAATAPMITSQSIPSLSTSVDAASSPSPPPASNRSSMMPSPTSSSPFGSDRSRPSNYLPHSQVAGINPHSNSHLGATQYSSQGSGNHHPHRAATTPGFPMPTTTLNSIPERSHSQGAGPVGSNSYSNFSPIRPTPHLVTKARPPDLGVFLGRVDVTTSPAPPVNVQSSSPPSTSLLFSSSSESMSPLSASLSDAVVSPQNIQTYNHFGVHQQGQLGFVDATGTNASGLDPVSLLTKLKIALAMSPIAEVELRAVASGQLNANYQAVLHALKHQQHFQKTTSTQVPSSEVEAHNRRTQSPVDYQLLITEVGRLEIKALQSQQQMALDSVKRQQEAAPLQQQQQLVINQLAQEQLLSTGLQSAPLAQQQALMNQQAQEQAILIQQQQAALAQQQSQQAQEAAMKLQLQLQQQQILAQQQALMQANQQQLQALQASNQQLLSQYSQQTPSGPPFHQGGQQQQQQGGGLGSFMGSVVGGGSHQQSAQGQSAAVSPQLMSHLVHSVVTSLQHHGSGGSGGSNPSSTDASNSNGGNVGLMDSLTQSLNNFNGGNNSQDPSSGLFGGYGNMDMFSGNVDFSSLTSNTDFSSLGSGIDFSSFGSNNDNWP